MDIKEREEFAKKLDRLTDEDKYEEILAMYDAIPKYEWDLKMKVDYAKTLNNMAMYTYETNYAESRPHFKNLCKNF